MATISVVMPVYNSEKYIKEAIDSVLNQTYRDFEFIIINDCSTDDSKRIILAYSDNRIRYYENEKNSGIAVTFNKGIELATGEFIARIDSDDICVLNRLEKQIEYLNAHRKIGACGGAMHLFDEKGDISIRRLPTNHMQAKVNMLFNMSIANPTSMMRTSIVEENNIRCNDAYLKAEDYDFWAYFSEVSDISNLPDVLVKYRIHNSQVTNIFSLEQIMAADKVRKRLIKRLVPNITESSFSLFKKVAMGERKFSSCELKELQLLFKICLENNKKLKVYCNRILRSKFSLINFYLEDIERGRKAEPFSGIEHYWTFKKKIRKILSKIKDKQ